MQDHLAYVQQHADRIAEELGAAPQVDAEGLALPELGEHVWAAFLALHAGRAGNVPLTYEGIAAWAQLVGETLRPWEVEAVKRIDAAWLEAAQQERKQRG